MAAEKKIKALALAKGNLKYVNDKFQQAYGILKGAAHCGGKTKFNAARADYDQAFELREKVMARYDFACGL